LWHNEVPYPIAPVGHAFVQIRQPRQSAGSTFAFPPTMAMALNGQADAQFPQPTHFSALTVTEAVAVAALPDDEFHIQRPRPFLRRCPRPLPLDPVPNGIFLIPFSLEAGR